MLHPINLYYVTWNVTNRCNLRCKHCYADANNYESDELSTNDGYRLIAESKRMGAKYILFTGGEPLLRDDIFKLLSFAKQKKLIVLLATNGTLIKKEQLKKLKQYTNHVNISLDSYKPEIHDHIRGIKGSFDRTEKTLHMLIENGISTSISFTAHDENINDLPGIAKICKNYNIALNIKRLISTGRGKNMTLSAKNYNILTKKIDVLKNKGYKINFKDPLYASVNKPLTKYGGCLAGIHLISVAANGDIYPCTKLKLSLGNIRKQKFSHIWKNSLILDKLRNRKIEGICGNCTRKISCGGCRAAAYAETDNIFGEDPFAKLAEICKSSD